MVEGELVEVRPSDWRRARELLRDLDGVLEVQSYGEILHVFLDSLEGRLPSIERALQRSGIDHRGLRRTPPRMEEAFISLIRRMTEHESVERPSFKDG
jgi:hypothetical protein